MPFRTDDSSDNDDIDHFERDPGREVIERNTRNRLQRIANHTKDELNKVLKRVDKTLVNYEHSVQSALAQQAGTRGDRSNVQHVADINELEMLLNDSIAKQKYKQRLTVFIVGQTELASEKASLLQQIEQFFSEQKQSFSGNEFNNYDTRNETQDETDLALRSFDVKDCYLHVKQLGTKLNELNDDIVTYLIQNATARLQAKGRKKVAQATKETKDQLSGLQQKLESLNNEMMNKDSKIEALEKANETLQRDLKSKTEYLKQVQQEVVQYTLEIKSRNKHITELEVNIKQYQKQIEELTNTIAALQQAKAEEPPAAEEPAEPEQAAGSSEDVPPIEKEDKETQTIAPRKNSSDRNQPIPVDEDLPNLNSFFNVPDGVDLINVTGANLPTAFTNLRKFAVLRVREILQNQAETSEPANTQELEDLQREYQEYRTTQEKACNTLIEKADHACQLQMEAEEALDRLESIMAEQEQARANMVHQQSQTDDDDGRPDNRSTPEEYSIPIVEVSNEHSSDSEEDHLEETEKGGTRTSSREKYVSFIEERKNQLGHRTHQPDPASRRTSLREGPLQSLDTNSGSIKHRLSNASIRRSSHQEHRREIPPVIKHDHEQQTSAVNSRSSSRYRERYTTKLVQTDDNKVAFYHLYELLYKFRQSIIRLLEQNNFLTLADRLLMVKQLTSDDQYTSEHFLDNAERALKDTRKVLQSCLALLSSSINEYQIKQQESLKESSELTREPSMVNDQQALLLEEKEAAISDLTQKYEQLMNTFTEANTKHSEEINQSERFIVDQQKLIQNLQQQLIRLQKRLSKIEAEGVVAPSIMFTRLDAERNEQTLQHAVHKGKVPESIYNELNEAMDDYVSLPSQQFANLVKRYIQFRKAAEIEGRIQTEAVDNDTRDVLERMEALYERRADEISRQIVDVQQQRTHLAKILTEQFDNLEDDNSIFLIRPVYSYQGRSAVQSYMKQEKQQREALLNESKTKGYPHPTRQTQQRNNQHDENQYLTTPMSSYRVSNEKEQFFNIDQSVPQPRSPPSRQQFTVQLGDLPRLQEYDIQRTLMPMSHVTAPLLSGYTSNVIDPCVPSLNLRSYLALSRPGAGSVRTGNTYEVAHNVSREGPASVSAKRLAGSAQTPINSVNGEGRRTSPQLPPIKRSSPTGAPTTIHDKQLHGFGGTNEVTSTT